MSIERIPEPELMDETEQAVAYAQADFEEPHNHFIELLMEQFADTLPSQGRAADLGCGAADISIRFARVFPDYDIDAIDGSEAMLEQGRLALQSVEQQIANRVYLYEALLQDVSLAAQDYALVFSNSLLHHLHDPQVLWDCLKTSIGNPKVFIMDLMRPDNEQQVEAMVETYASEEPEVLQRDFRNSLKAAFTVNEVEVQLKQAGIQGFAVNAVSDRHLVISGKISTV